LSIFCLLAHNPLSASRPFSGRTFFRVPFTGRVADANQGAAMNPNDEGYFEKRANAELEKAHHATDPKAAQIHHQLAKAYSERVKADPSPSPEGDT
jgi:hypothetical protein